MRNNIKKVIEFSLKSKLLLITSLITIVVISIMSLIFYNRLYHQTTSLLQQALFIAKSVALLIDADEFERISLGLDSNINYFILRRLTRPLEQLVKSIGIMATGDLTIELVHNDNNEIGRINGAINETVSKIREILIIGPPYIAL